MSRALVCDNCDAVLPLNKRGEHDGGEDSAWLKLTLTNESFDPGIARIISGADEEPTA